MTNSDQLPYDRDTLTDLPDYTQLPWDCACGAEATIRHTGPHTTMLIIAHAHCPTWASARQCIHLHHEADR